MSAGRDIYDNQCADRYGDNGEVEWPTYPPLAGDHTLAANTPTNVIRLVSHGGFGTATHADALLHQLRQAGLAVYRVPPKRVSDAREIHDGAGAESA